MGIIYRMSYFQSLILGLVQGLTEFLPVSSSGHILLTGELLGVTPSLAFELILHVATLIAVVVFYRKSIFLRLKKPFSLSNLYLVVATVITAVFALLLRKTVGNFPVSRLPIFFLVTACLLLTGSFFGKGNKKMTLGKSAVIGLTQGLACIPGLSRSGSTISVALAMGVEKNEATEFSFLLSIPIILGSSIVELIGAPIGSVDLGVTAVGFVAALVSGYAALLIVNKLMKKASLDLFAVYLVALSIVLIFANYVF